METLPPTYQEAIANEPRETTNKSKQGDQTRIDVPLLFSTSDADCMTWCCYSSFCLGLAMAQIGDQVLREQAACCYVFIFFMIGCSIFFVLPTLDYVQHSATVNHDDLEFHHELGKKLARWFGMEEQLEESEWIQDIHLTSAQILKWVLIVTITLCFLIMCCAYRQRRKLMKLIKHEESDVETCLIACCCTPCSYGQMGAVIKHV